MKEGEHEEEKKPKLGGLSRTCQRTYLMHHCHPLLVVYTEHHLHPINHHLSSLLITAEHFQANYRASIPSEQSRAPWEQRDKREMTIQAVRSSKAAARLTSNTETPTAIAKLSNQ